MLADKQRTVYPEEITRRLHIMAQARESSPVIERRSNHCDNLPLFQTYKHNHRPTCKIGLQEHDTL